MKSLLIIPLVVILSACGSNPSKPTFPEPPARLMQTPVELKTILPTKTKLGLVDKSAASEVPLSAVTKIISDNYTTCNAYKENILGLQEWITVQKAIYNEK